MSLYSFWCVFFCWKAPSSLDCHSRGSQGGGGRDVPTPLQSASSSSCLPKQQQTLFASFYFLFHSNTLPRISSVTFPIFLPSPGCGSRAQFEFKTKIKKFKINGGKWGEKEDDDVVRWFGSSDEFCGTFQAEWIGKSKCVVRRKEGRTCTKHTGLDGGGRETERGGERTCVCVYITCTRSA